MAKTKSPVAPLRTAVRFNGVGRSEKRPPPPTKKNFWVKKRENKVKGILPGENRDKMKLKPKITYLGSGVRGFWVGGG